MTAPWPAVGAETDPRRRARQLQKSWERLLADGALGPELPTEATAGLRPTIVESWRRSLATGLDPTDLLAPIVADESEVLQRWLDHPLGSLAHVLTAQLGKVAEESRGIVVVTDATGLVLQRVGDERLKERASEMMNLIEGARYSEAADGTNGIGTALAADDAFQVFAFEHFNERHHQWVCSGAPVHDPVSGQVIGLIDLSSLWKIAHPRSLELVTAAAKTIERYLLDARRNTDARLRRRYSDFMTRRTDLLVDRDGYVLDGAAPPQPSPFEIPEGGGEIVLANGSGAIAAPLGQGEAYLVRRITTRPSTSAPRIVGLERAEERARELATEQAALRQVATLVARESTPDQLFVVVAEQVARVFDVPHVGLVRYEPDGWVVISSFSDGEHGPFPVGSRWPLGSPGVIATVRQTGRAARIEDYTQVPGEIAAVVRDAGMRSAFASPIVVERRLWGAIVVLSARREPFPESTEARLTDFTELIATAISNAEARAAVTRLADEQSALRRVATLVARGVSPQDLFEAVAEEVGRLLPVDSATMGRFELDGSVTTVASWSSSEVAFPTRGRWPIEGTNVAWMVIQTGQSARLDDFSAATDPTGVGAREAGIKSAVGSPIVVEGRLWGIITAASTEGLMPPGAEERLASFTELVATSIANAESHGALEQLANEQMALRRVATLVAEDVQPSEIFSAVSAEVSRLFDAGSTVLRYERDGPAVVFVAVAGFDVEVGTRWEFQERMASAEVYRTGRPARVDDVDWSSRSGTLAAAVRRLGVVSTVASPIIVGGRLWGAMTVHSTDGVLQHDAEDRLANFSQLVATAIANAVRHGDLATSEARAHGLATEQAALRRVATLVARGGGPEPVFRAVADETVALLGCDTAAIVRFESDGMATVMGGHNSRRKTGARIPLDRNYVVSAVRETGRAARFDTDDPAAERMPEPVRVEGIRSALASPIVVDGALWGAITVGSLGVSIPAIAEQRLADFTDLVATSVANAEGKSELAASRRRIVAASDEARRRIERDLHDGIQQRLVALTLRARAMSGKPPDDLRTMAAELAEGLVAVADELRGVSLGIHPTVLTKAGLGPALRALGRKSGVPVELAVSVDERLPEPVEVAAYYVASEALTNAAKHSQATVVELAATHNGGVLTLEVCDDGVGGADVGRGSGIVGLIDRVEALGGTITIASPPGGGTTLSMRLPSE